MARSTERSDTMPSTVELVDALIHFEAARIALRCQFEGTLDLLRADLGPPGSVSGPVIPRMTSLGAA
jgi:hypothetical protein